MTEPDTPHSFNNSTTYTYNGLNQLTNVSMQTASGTQTRSFTYSGLDRITETNPENGTVTYTYDTAHHVLTKTDAIGQQVHYNYDSYGRLTAKYCYPLVGGVPQLDPNQTVLYYYDTNPHEPGFSTNSQGRLTAVEMNTSQWYEYNYSVPGRITNQRLQVAGHDYDASYSWDSEGRLASHTWPSEVSPSTGPQYSYQYDSMGRMSSMQDSLGNTVATAAYDVANNPTGLTYFGLSETRTYNNMSQLISQSVPGAISMQYNYTAGQNSGRISSSVDRILGETVNYSYDSLNRLASASATNGAWSQSYSFDGFGNLTYKSAAGAYTAYSATFNPASNQQNGVAYDANGNQTANGTFDVSNRMVTASAGGGYTYDYRGKRIVKMQGTAELYFYGIDGKKLTTLACDYYMNCGSPVYNVYFKGKLVQSQGNTVVTDRLGSVRWNSGYGGSAYFPYGEERTVNTEDREKFGTYMRDTSGQDYADQRYYGVGTGRFWSVDPGGIGTANWRNPMTWNRYPYGSSDPINRFDPTGRSDWDADPDLSFPDDPEETDPTDGAGTGAAGGGGTSTIPDTGTWDTIADDDNVPDPENTDPTPAQPCAADTCITVSGTLALVPVVQTPPGTELIPSFLSNAFGWLAGGLTRVITIGGGILLTPTTMGCETLSPCPNMPMTVTYVEAHCTPTGPPVVIPSTRRGNKGGKSIEQEYTCPDGNTYTIHTLTNPQGKPIDKHVRPGKPKYGPPGAH